MHSAFPGGPLKKSIQIMMAYDMFLPDLHPCSGSGQDMVQFDLAWLQYNPEFMLELICGHFVWLWLQATYI